MANGRLLFHALKQKPLHKSVNKLRVRMHVQFCTYYKYVYTIFTWLVKCHGDYSSPLQNDCSHYSRVAIIRGCQGGIYCNVIMITTATVQKTREFYGTNNFICYYTYYSVLHSKFFSKLSSLAIKFHIV